MNGEKKTLICDGSSTNKCRRNDRGNEKSFENPKHHGMLDLVGKRLTRNGMFT